MKIKNILIALLFVVISVCTFSACDDNKKLTISVANGTVVCEDHPTVEDNATFKFKKGAEVTLTAVANNGYEFVAWYTGSEMYSEKATTTFLMKADKKLTANFKKTLYTISYNLNGGSVNGETTLENVSLGISDAVPTVTPTYTGKKFVGWFLDGTETQYSETTFTTLGNKALVAKYVDGRTITFNLDGGNINGSTDNVVKNLFLNDNLDIANPVKTGYRFTGWTVNDVAYTGSTLTVDADTTFTATYLQEFAMSFQDENGDAISGLENKVICKADVVSLPTQTKDGYRFNGWVSGDTTYTDSITIGEAKNYVMKASYSQEFTITFYTGATVVESGFDAVENKIVYAGDKLGDLETPKVSNQTINKTSSNNYNKVACKFKCWTYKGEPVTSETVFNYGKNIVLVARCNVFRIKFDLTDGVASNQPNNTVNGLDVLGSQTLAEVLPYYGSYDQGISSSYKTTFTYTVAGVACPFVGFSYNSNRGSYCSAADFAKTLTNLLKDKSISEKFSYNYAYQEDGALVLTLDTNGDSIPDTAAPTEIVPIITLYACYTNV